MSRASSETRVDEMEHVSKLHMFREFHAFRAFHASDSLRGFTGVGLTGVGRVARGASLSYGLFVRHALMGESWMHQILPRLCTSGPLCADWGHDEELARRGVTLVLDLDGAAGDGEEIPEWVAHTMKPEEWSRVGIRYCAVPCDDPPSTASLAAACEVIRSELADPRGRVHVHCGRSPGHERTAAVIAAWLMSSRRVRNVEDAAAWMERRLPSTNIHATHKKVLREFATTEGAPKVSKVSNGTTNGGSAATEEGVSINPRQHFFDTRGGAVVAGAHEDSNGNSTGDSKTTDCAVHVPAGLGIDCLSHCVLCNVMREVGTPVTGLAARANRDLRASVAAYRHTQFGGTVGAMVWHLSRRRAWAMWKSRRCVGTRARNNSWTRPRVRSISPMAERPVLIT